MITLSGLIDADLASVRYVAERWLRLGEEIDAAVDDLGRDTRDLPNHWRSGPGAEAARARGTEVRTRVANSQQYCVLISAELSRFAAGLDGCRERALQVIADARARGLTVDVATGRITAPIEQGGLVDGYARQIGEIVSQANDADRRTTESLARLRFAEQELPGAEPPRHDEVAVLAAATYDYETQSRWWRGLHPLQQERAIAELPEVVGAMGGVPPRDRDAANRILFRRYRDSVAASRPADPSGPADRALIEANDRRAAIAELEERLAGPQPYLIGYEPGRERDAILSD